MKTRHTEHTKETPICTESIPRRIHFDDNVWYTIFEYFGTEHDLNHRKRNKSKTSFRPIHLFKAMICASKEDHARLIRYVQHVPQMYRYCKEDQYLLPWFCRYGAKLESIDFHGKIHSNTELAFFLWMLKYCNTSTLTSLKANFCWTRRQFDRKFDGIRKHTAELLQSRDPFYVFVDMIESLSTSEKCMIVKDFLCENSKTVINLSMSVTSDQLGLPFFMNTGSSQSPLKHLKLNIQKGMSSNLTIIYQGIANSHNLKSLNLSVGSQYASLAHTHRIESRSLEEIDVRGSEIGFIVSECRCPSLKVFRGKYVPHKRWYNHWIGVRAQSPITKMEIDRKIEEGQFVDFDDSIYGSHTLQYVVGARPFSGMEVPDACIVLIDVLNYT